MKACPACNTRYDDQTTFCVKDGSPVVPDVLTPQAPMIGQLIGDRYRILRKIGEGGMGEVYVAEHIHIEKKVALKLLRPEVLSNAEAVARFRQEARSASAIGHDNIIQIDDFGTMPDGRVYMAMEYLQGSPLNDLIAREPLPLPRALDILIQVGKGLAAAHVKGITHRDMKPENVFVTNKEGRDVPKILDFGIAKVSGGDTAQNLTVAGTIFGTPFYMAPEQAMGGKMDHRVDIYAMGIILYEVFCGQVPFKAETFMGILTQHITMQPEPPSQMASRNGRIVAHELEAIILKAIQKDPTQRYQSMAELVNALMEYARFAGVMPTTQVWGASTSWPVQGRQTGAHEKKGNGGLIAAVIGAVVVIGGGGGIWYATSRPGVVKTGGADAGTQVVKVAPPDAATVVKAPPPDAATAQVIAKTTPDAPTKTIDPHVNNNPPDRATRILVEFDSTPPGAFVAVNGRNYGQAPVKVEIERGKKNHITLTLRGYKTMAFDADGSTQFVHKSLTLKDLQTPDGLKPPEDDDGLATPKNH